MIGKFLQGSTALPFALTWMSGISASAETARPLDIASQDMVAAIAELGEKTGLQIVAPNELLAGRRSAPVSGPFSGKEALLRMLDDPDLGIAELSDGTLVISDESQVNFVSQNSTEAPFDLGTIELFTAGRRSEAIENIPQTVVVVEGEQLAREIESSQNLSAALGKLIPNYSAPDPIVGGGNSNTLRGREPLILLDGIPLAFTNNFGQFLNSIDPGIIDRVEVIYGPSALYGQGAGGGVIQLFTRSPSLEFEGRLTFGVTTYLTEDNAFDGDGNTFRTALSISDTVERFSYFGYLAYEETGGALRADGALTAPDRIQFAENITGFLKYSYELTESSRLTFSIDSYESDQTEEAFRFAGLTTDEGFQLTQPADPVFSYVDPPGNRSTNVNVIYDNDDLAGGIFRLQGYYRENRFLNPGSDIREQVDLGDLPAEWSTVWQTGQDGKEYGLRGEYTRELSGSVTATFGFDYAREERGGEIVISDRDVFEATNAFNGAERDFNTPPYELDSVGIFAQVDADLSDRFSVTGGVRYDHYRYSVEPYDVIFNFGTPRGLRPGGEGSSNTYSINAGLSYDLTPEATVFANYSQGLQLPDIANSANSLDPGVPLPGSLFVEPIDVEAIDIGIRGFSGNFSYAASVFYSRSDLGEAINLTGAGLGERVRSPQRNWGMELSGSYRASEKLSLSGSLSLQEGEFDRSDDGNFVALNSRTVPPPQLRLQADYQLNAETTIFGSLFASGRRAKAFEEGQDFFEPESYTVVDVGLVYEKDRFRLSAQITNLLNEAYSPVAQSSFIPGRRREGPGRALTITASYKF